MKYAPIIIIIGFLVLAAFFFYNSSHPPMNIQENKLNAPSKEGTLKLTSPAFQSNSPMPAKYTCDGENINPPLLISGVPNSAKSLALIMDDPDAPGKTWDHWVTFNLSSTTGNIKEREEPAGVKGLNSWGKTGYGGPCPPSGTHRYIFRLYALDSVLSTKEGATKTEVFKAMEGHVIVAVDLIGLYKRSR